MVVHNRCRFFTTLIHSIDVCYEGEGLVVVHNRSLFFTTLIHSINVFYEAEGLVIVHTVRLLRVAFESRLSNTYKMTRVPSESSDASVFVRGFYSSQRRKTSCAYCGGVHRWTCVSFCKYYCVSAKMVVGV